MLLSLLFTHSPLCMCFWINDYEGPYLCLRDWLLFIFSDSFSHWVKWKRRIILWLNFPLSFVFSGCLVNLSGKLVWSHRALDFHLGIIFYRIWDKNDVIIFMIFKTYIASMTLMSPVVQWKGINFILKCRNWKVHLQLHLVLLTEFYVQSFSATNLKNCISTLLSF